MTVRHLLALAALGSLCATGLFADDKAGDDTAKAAATRKILKEKISVSFKDTRLEDAIEEIKDTLKEKKKPVVIRLDAKGGVSRNQSINFKADDKPLEEIFDQMFKKNGLGYIVISGKNNAYDGSILIKQGKERGYPLTGKE
jgi:autotransporter-associated beta strand protein